MSTGKRIISGTVASWMRIFVTLLSQMILVPVYLSYWDVTTYGLWLTIQALLTVIITIDHGHQTFLEFEFLKISKYNPGKISLVLWSGVSVGIILGAIAILFALFFVFSGFLRGYIGNSTHISPALLKDAGILLIILSIINLLTTSAGGLYVRALSPFGYYSRMSWWGVFAAVFTACAPVIAVIYGAGFLKAGIVLALSTIAYNIPLLIDVYQKFKKEKILYQKISFKTGLQNFVLSLVLSGKELLENLRQQGLRVVLAPLIGISGLTAFSTMRTGSNIALQGLNTVTNPLMPELMRFLHEKNQVKMEAAFSTVWIILILFLAPGVVLLQAIAQPLYVIWTKGHISFNPLLFALLSLSVLVFAISQPAIAIIRGNNIVKTQLYISIIITALLLLGVITLVPKFGMVAAGISILVSEIISCIIYTYVARKWLSEYGLFWPKKSSSLASLSVIISMIAMIAMAVYTSSKVIIALVSIGLLLWNALLYWKNLPGPIKQHARLFLTDFTKKIKYR